MGLDYDSICLLYSTLNKQTGFFFFSVKVLFAVASLKSNGLCGEDRTRDFLLPKQTRYQAALHTEKDV